MHSPHIQTITHSLHANRTLGQTSDKHDHGRNTRIRRVVSRCMPTHSAFRTLLTLAALSLPLGCDASDTAPDDVRAVPLVQWDDVVCTIDENNGCFAHSPSAAELWSPVLSWSDLQIDIDNGYLVETLDGWEYPCDLGGRPESFEDVRCFYDVQDNVVCFGGSVGWYTRVEPSCAPTFFTINAWQQPSCDPDKSPGVHAYDSVKVLDGTYNVGRVTNGNDAFGVAPECVLPGNEMQAANPYWLQSAPEPGDLGGECVRGRFCDSGLMCAVAENGSTVCAPPFSGRPCSHGLDLQLGGIAYQGACVAACVQGYDSCGGGMECSPKDAYNVGFCAWPT